MGFYSNDFVAYNMWLNWIRNNSLWFSIVFKLRNLKRTCLLSPMYVALGLEACMLDIIEKLKAD